MSWLNLGSLAGFFVLAALGWAAGGFARPVRWQTVLGSGALMGVLGFFVFLVPVSRALLIATNDAVLSLLAAGNQGALFLLGPPAPARPPPPASPPSGSCSRRRCSRQSSSSPL